MSAAGGRLPSLFVAHGAPPLLDDDRWVGELRAWARRPPKARAILMLSAHWEQRPVTIGATTRVPLNSHGFPARYYEQQYGAPGAPDLAARVRSLLEPQEPVLEDPQRGLDHGAYVPLVAMYPEADVPVLQVSLPTHRCLDGPPSSITGRPTCSHARTLTTCSITAVGLRASVRPFRRRSTSCRWWSRPERRSTRPGPLRFPSRGSGSVR